MFRLNLFIILFVCFICSSFSVYNDIAYSPNCTASSNALGTNSTYDKYASAYLTYLGDCVKALNYNNTKVTCQNTSDSAVANFKTFCTGPIEYSLNGGKNYTTDTAKWCTVTVTGSPTARPNVTYTLVYYDCVISECYKNDTDITSMGKNAAGDLAYGLNWNTTTATGTVKCSGFPTWAIILIIIIIIIVAVLIIVAVVVMLRRRTQYQNI
jgi:hypothetical protein